MDIPFKDFDKIFSALKIAQANVVKCISVIREKEVLKDKDTRFSLNLADLEMTFEKMDDMEIMNELETLKDNLE